jgi:molybdopterin molybdotransferase
MIPFEQAYEQILEEINLLSCEIIPLWNATGRIVRDDIKSPLDLPTFSLSGVDGYAVKCADIQAASETNPVKLEVIDTIAAGKFSSQSVTPGKTIRILTGAPIPEGTEAIVMQEFVERKENQVTFTTPADKGDNIRPKGEDVKTDEIVIKSGTILRPSEILMLGAMGMDRVMVGKRPRVAIIPTGDEVVPLDEPLEAGKVRNSNQYGIAAAVVHCNGNLILSKIIRDDEVELEMAIRDCIDAGADLILTIGGVSVGDYDITKTVFQKMGHIKLWRVAIQPGKPLAFGKIQNIPVMGLPGFPVSCMVIFEEFVRAILWKMQGRYHFERPCCKAILDENISRQPGRQAFYRGIAEKKANGVYHVKPTGPQGSGIISSLVKANCFIILPADRNKYKAGEEVTIQFPEILAS